MSIRELEAITPADWFYDVRDQLKWHVYLRSLAAFANGDAARDSIRSLADLEARQADIRRGFLASIGGLPPMDTPLHAATSGVVYGPGCRIEKVIFQSRPHHHVTANLYLPDKVRAPSGAVLFLCGHHQQAKHQPEYQSVCQTLVQAGLVVLAQDPVGQGERLGYYDPETGESAVAWGTVEHDYCGAQCLPAGDALARYFLHDAIRGFDYLAGRPEVDPLRIGVTGNSGGGTQTCLMMLGDPRIAAAAPATFLMNRRNYLWAGEAQDAEQIWPGFAARTCDRADVLIAMAPRPVRVLAVTGDFFPIEGTRESVGLSRRFWELAGNPGGLDLVEDASLHCYTPALARAAGLFFRSCLLGLDDVPHWREPAPIEPRLLWCTQSGQVRGDFAEARGVPEANRERIAEQHAMRRALPGPERHDRARAWLNDRVCSHRAPCDLNPRFYAAAELDGLQVQMAFWWAQEGVFSHGRLSRPAGVEAKLPVTLAVWDGGSASLEAHLLWIKATVAKDRAVLVLDVTAVGAVAPRALSPRPLDEVHGTLHKMETDLLWLDDDLAAMRTFDVLRALDMLGIWPGIEADSVDLYVNGRQGLYGRLAAILDGRIGRVEVVGGDRSCADWAAAAEYDSAGIHGLILRGMLQHFDLPELEDDRFTYDC